MRRFFAISFAVFSAASLLSSCTQRIGDFTVVSTKNYARQVAYKNVGRMEGQDKAFIILGIPTGIPNLKTAVDRAIEAGGGVYLENAVIESSYWFFIIGQTGYTVTGDVYAPAEQGDLLNPEIELFYLKEDASGASMQSSRTGERRPVQDITGLVSSR